MFHIEDGRASFYQWDIDRKIVVEDSSIKVVHMANTLDDTAAVIEVKDGLAAVPNEMLQQAAWIVVYGYDTNRTLCREHFGVIRRERPADYVYTPTEVLKWSELDKRIELIEKYGGGSGGEASFVPDDVTIKADGRILSVVTAEAVEKDNTLPVSSAAVYTEVGNIDALLKTI